MSFQEVLLTCLSVFQRCTTVYLCPQMRTVSPGLNRNQIQNFPYKIFSVSCADAHVCVHFSSIFSSAGSHLFRNYLSRPKSDHVGSSHFQRSVLSSQQRCVISALEPNHSQLKDILQWKFRYILSLPHFQPYPSVSCIKGDIDLYRRYGLVSFGYCSQCRNFVQRSKLENCPYLSPENSGSQMQKLRDPKWMN